MRIAFVTSWGTHCGIATYTEQLSYALLDAGHTIIIYAPNREGSCASAPPDIPYHINWAINGGGLDELVAAVQRDEIDVLHYQHEFGLHVSGEALLRTLVALREHVPVVVTLHTVFPPLSYDSRGPFFEALDKRVAAVVVHTPEAEIAVAVAGAGKKSLLAQVPHGTPSVRAGDPMKGRQILELPRSVKEDTPVGLVSGFMSPGKNLVSTVRAFGLAVQRWLGQVGVLVLCGSSEFSGGFVHGRLQGAIVEAGVENRVFTRPSYVRATDVPHVMSAGTYGILNTWSNTLSASGQVHQYAACQVPIAVANRPIYSDAVRAGLPCFNVDPRDPEQPSPDLVAAIGYLATSEGFRQRCKAAQARLATATAWPRVAKTHEALYKMVKR